MSSPQTIDVSRWLQCRLDAIRATVPPSMRSAKIQEALALATKARELIQREGGIRSTIRSWSDDADRT